MITQARCLTLTSGALGEAMTTLTVYFALVATMQSDLVLTFSILYPILTGICALISGAIADKIPRIKISRLAPIFLILAALLGASTPPSLSTVVAMSCLFAIFTGIEYSTTRTLIAEYAQPWHRFKWSSETIALYQIGMTIALVWYSYFYGTEFVISGLYFLIGCVGLFALIGRWNMPNSLIHDKILQHPLPCANFMHYAFNRKICKVILFIGCTYIIYSVILTILLKHGVYVAFGYQLSTFFIFIITSIFAIQTIFCTLFPERARILYGVSAIIFLVLIYLLQTNCALIEGATFAIIFGLFSGISPNLFYQQWVVEFTPTRYRATMRGFFSLLTRICVGGAIFLASGVEMSVLFDIAFIACLISSVIAVRFMPNSTGVTLEKVDRRFEVM